MDLEANIVYLDEELKNNLERLELMEEYLKKILRFPYTKEKSILEAINYE